MQAPWTEIGRLESEVMDIRAKLCQMAKSHEVSQVGSDVASLERTVRELSATFDDFRYELETLHEKVRELWGQSENET